MGHDAPNMIGTDARGPDAASLRRQRHGRYVDVAWQAGRDAGTITTKQDLVEHALDAATLRVRPLLMTVLANVFGLLPILVDEGVGADLAKRIALPMWGGLVSLTILTIFVIPAVYVVWRSYHLRRSANQRLGSLATRT